MTIPFIKAHGAGNDFLLSWADRVTAGDLPATRSSDLQSPHRHRRGWLDFSSRHHNSVVQRGRQ